VPGRVYTHEYVAADDAGVIPNDVFPQTTNRGDAARRVTSLDNRLLALGHCWYKLSLASTSPQEISAQLCDHSKLSREPRLQKVPGSFPRS
jgi:hypothetical protein